MVHAVLINHGARVLPAAYFREDMLSVETVLVNLTELIPILNVNNLIGLKDYYHFISYAWAVFIEVMFYLSVFAICLVSGRRFTGMDASGSFLFYCTGGFILLAHVCHEYVQKLYRPLSFVPYFLLGVLLYRLRKRAGAAEWTGVVLVVPLMLLHFSRYIQGEVPLDHAWVANLVTAKGLTDLVLLVMAAVLIYPLSYASAGLRLKNADRWLGDLSYPLYLNHYVIVVGFATLLEEKGAWYQMAAILLSLALAYGMKVMVEAPLRRDSQQYSWGCTLSLPYILFQDERLACCMNILHLSTEYNLGGSGRAAYRIHSSLIRRGHTSRMLVSGPVLGVPEAAPIWGTVPWRAADWLARRTTEALSLQYLFLPSSWRLLRHPWFRQADVVQLYNTHGGYFSHSVLGVASRRKPFVWRLSDMWPMTGHCCYSYDCDRWKTGCGSCPLLDDDPALKTDRTALLWRTKQRIYADANVTLVAPSQWIAGLAKQSPLVGHWPVQSHSERSDLECLSTDQLERQPGKCLGLPQDEIRCPVQFRGDAGLSQGRHLRGRGRQCAQGEDPQALPPVGGRQPRARVGDDSERPRDGDRDGERRSSAGRPLFGCGSVCPSRPGG